MPQSRYKNNKLGPVALPLQPWTMACRTQVLQNGALAGELGNSSHRCRPGIHAMLPCNDVAMWPPSTQMAPPNDMSHTAVVMLRAHFCRGFVHLLKLHKVELGQWGQQCCPVM